MRTLAPASIALSALAWIAACGRARMEAEPAGAAGDAQAPEVEAATDAPPESLDAGPGDAGRLAVTGFQTSVVDRPSWPESGAGAKKLGYLRHGTIMEAYERPIVNDDCKEGWYELVLGGFVCGKAATLDLASPKVRLAPRQPDRDAGMPYRYGVNVRDGTPLYRRVLSLGDRKKYEPDLAPPEPAAHEEGHSDPTDGEEGARAEEEAPAGRRAGPADAGADAGKKRLKELKGRGVLVRKMERGFYVALDRDFKAAGAHWWRTTFGFATPFERVLLQPGVTKYHGSWFFGAELAPATTEDGGASLAGSVGFLTHDAQKLAIEDGKVKWGPELPKRSAVMLTGRTQTVSGVVYHEAAGGFWVRVADLKLARPAPPSDLTEGEKWIDVDLTRQALVAFEGTRPVFGALVSSGRRNPWDKEHDFPTPTGTFRIGEKHVTTTMDGDVASDGPYSIEDVPWVMYFQGSYALHGAFWHDSFGHSRSHGCVNMAPEDARALFAWADPELPRGWHGVIAKTDKDGSRVVIHEDTPQRR